MKKLIKDKKGGASVDTVVLVLCMALFLSAVFTYAQLMTTIQLTKSNTEYVLDSFVLHNATEVYNSIKKGNDYIEEIDADYYVEHAANDLALKREGELLAFVNDDEETLFTITIPKTTFQKDQTLQLVTTYEIILPVDFAGERLTQMRIPISVKSSYALKQ